jgi:choline monooxygenase
MPDTRTLPALWYADPAVLARERDAIFGREWLYVSRSSQLARRGDYVAVDACGWPVVVVALDDEGALAAFHNVCRHRAGPLVWDGEGNCGGSFVCRYHGWAYGLDGGLRNARDFGNDGIATAELGLHAVRVDTWRGLVFVCLDAAAPPLVDALGDFAEACDAFPIEDFVTVRDLDEAMAANWKAYADNYLEGYHLPLVHPELSRLVDVRRYEVVVHDGWCEHLAPARDGSPTAGRWIWRYPNLALNLYPDGMNIERFWPEGPGRTRVQYTYCFAADADPADVDSSVKLSLDLLDEDRRIVEAVQRNLDAGVYDAGELSPRHESGVAAFHARVRAALDS